MHHLSILSTRSAAGLSLALALAGGIALCHAPIQARASILPTDVLSGTTVEKSHLPKSDMPDIEAAAAIVVSKDGKVLYERAADKELKIASITKCMTATLVLEDGNMDDELIVSHAAATVGQSTSDLKEGDRLSVRTALMGLMLPSGNDAAMALAEYMGKKYDPGSTDPVSVFVAKMNERAAQLGMDHTKFTNPHGLDFDGWEADMRSSARDVATMFANAMKIKEFRDLLSSPDCSVDVTGQDGQKRSIELKNHNKVLGEGGNIGGKTGSTYEALDCFAGAYDQKVGGEIYVVTLGSKDDAQRWKDQGALSDWYYDNMVELPLADPHAVSQNGKPLVARVSHADWTDKTVDATAKGAPVAQVFAPEGDVELNLDARAAGDVREGDKLGTLKVEQNGKTLETVDLIAAENQAGPNPLEWIMVKLDRLVRLFTGEPRAEPSTACAASTNPLDYVRYEPQSHARTDTDA